jgi:hypothetical protein
MVLARNEKHTQCDLARLLFVPAGLLIGINSFAGVLFLSTAFGLNYSDVK